MIRWQAAIRIFPVLFASAAAVGVAWVVAGETTVVNLNVVLTVTVSITVPAALAKILWDRRQKRRQRGRLTDLERENRELTVEAARLRGENDALRRQIGSGSGRALGQGPQQGAP